MSISLEKGQKVSLTKDNNDLDKLIVGLGWDVNHGGFFSSAFDLDASAFCLGADGRITTRKDFVYFGNRSNDGKSVYHTGDNLTGAGDGDDEQIIVNLKSIPNNIERVVFTVNIYSAESRGQNFGKVNNAFIRIVDAKKNTEMCRYNLGKDFKDETAVVFGELYKNNGEWKFNAIGSGSNDFNDIRVRFGA